MAVKAVIPFLVTMMLVTGVCNTLLTKLQARICGLCVRIVKLTLSRTCNVFGIATARMRSRGGTLSSP
jgi:hypothetical protein